jgi:heptosyltransferase III
MQEERRTRLIFRYRLNKKIRTLATWITGLVTARSTEKQLDFHREQINKILLVRATFRMGDSILATPAILLFRRNFPDARIDFVGPTISNTLFQNLPIDYHYPIYQSVQKACWAYALLLKRLRWMKYDLAIDVSCSKSALSAFIVGFSGARFRIGLRGGRDRWFNVRLERPAENNKYRNLPAFVRAMGLETEELLPSVVLSAVEKENAKSRIKTLLSEHGDATDPVVGIFVGGRKSWGKRWPKENFMELITGLHAQRIKVIVFIGPEERDVIGFFKQGLPHGVPLVFEPSPRMFASLVSNCDLFVACDSGPVHLACALRVRTIAIFLQHNFHRWAPPPSLARIVYHDAGLTAGEVIEVCRLEVNDRCGEREMPKLVSA